MSGKLIYCPKCKSIVEPKSKSIPFCSERCRLIDLGNWASEKYAVPAEDQSPVDDNNSTTTSISDNEIN